MMSQISIISANRDTGDHKAEREMLRQSNGGYNCLIYLHVLFCSFNS